MAGLTITRPSGDVSCWGGDFAGELGDGTYVDHQLSPVAVTGLHDAIQLDTSWDHTCARRASGALVCWGANGRGMLGDGVAALPGCGGACTSTFVAVTAFP